ncbi:hypothetical protein RN001_012177 [Aquatica leii]|uniref:Uncharacterized protein n=1 Tax=Aquatica leii TaxID=1421715 RepID=A0AAN7NY63_9COLE|nr:hypothetical protein RN001_012177 [Aquatica leii]
MDNDLSCNVTEFRRVVSSNDDDQFSLNFSDQSVLTDSTVEDQTPENKQNLKKQYKKTFCMFCEVLIVSKHFSRHLRQNHKDKSAVSLLMESKCMKEKKEIIANIRAKGVLILQQRTGKIIPKRNPCPQSNDLDDYSICAYCKAFFKNSYITRHYKKCTQSLKSKNAKFENPKVSSFLFSLNSSYQMYLKSNPLRKNLIKKLRMDDIGKTAISDPIILEYGMRLLQTAKNVNKRIPLARNKMRECARLLIEIKPLLPIPSNDIKTIIDILKPEYIDYLVQSVKQVSKYSENERSFGAASYALHQGKTIKDLIDIAVYLLSKKDPIISQDSLKNSSEILQNLNTLSKIVEKNWAREIGSIALKDLNVKKSRNHNKKLLPLTQDIMKLRQHCLEKGKNSILALKAGVDKNQYLILLEVTFLLVLLHNRKRVGDVQFIELRDVTEINNIQETDEIFASLSKTEILLTKFYKKIHTIGKGSKELLILVPRDVQEFIDFLIKDRDKYDVEININDDTAILNSSSENEDAAPTSNFTIPISSTGMIFTDTRF